MEYVKIRRVGELFFMWKGRMIEGLVLCEIRCSLFAAGEADSWSAGASSSELGPCLCGEGFFVCLIRCRGLRLWIPGVFVKIYIGFIFLRDLKGSKI